MPLKQPGSQFSNQGRTYASLPYWKELQHGKRTLYPHNKIT
jgi:hypothetical protein